MPKPDEKIAEVGPFTIFRKSEEPYYEIVGPAVEHSPLSYTMIRTTLAIVDRIRAEIAADVKTRK
jgi:hypothetical protein